MRLFWIATLGLAFISAPVSATPRWVPQDITACGLCFALCCETPVNFCLTPGDFFAHKKPVEESKPPPPVVDGAVHDPQQLAMAY